MTLRTGLVSLCLAFFSFPAQAQITYQPAQSQVRHTSHHYGRYLASRHRHYVHRRYAHRFHDLGICGVAARMGGPCGCYASIRVFGRSVRNLWLANNWLRFPRTSAHAGAVAVWPGRHVAMITAVSGDRIQVADSWATHWVSARGKVIVEPRWGRASAAPGLVAWASGAPL